MRLVGRSGDRTAILLESTAKCEIELHIRNTSPTIGYATVVIRRQHRHETHTTQSALTNCSSQAVVPGMQKQMIPMVHIAEFAVKTQACKDTRKNCELHIMMHTGALTEPHNYKKAHNQTRNTEWRPAPRLLSDCNATTGAREAEFQCNNTSSQPVLAEN